MKKIDCHGFSGIASQRVEWVDPNIEQVKREAPSPSFLQEKQKHLKYLGGASQSQVKWFLFEQHSTPKHRNVSKDAHDHAVENSEVFDVAATFMCCFQAIH